MRVAIVSDIHGNLTAFEAVLADLRVASPDLILHGGDLSHGGSRPAQVIDKIHELGWEGVLGNTDEILFRPKAIAEFFGDAPERKPLREAIEKMASWTAEKLGDDRLKWLHGLPLALTHDGTALVHASPKDLWRAPMPDATDDELRNAYAMLAQPIAVYAHIHRSYVRKMPSLMVANTGSVSLSHDGDPRASYLLIDDSKPEIRRVEYDLEAESEKILGCGIPHADWVAKMLRNGRPEPL